MLEIKDFEKDTQKVIPELIEAIESNCFEEEIEEIIEKMDPKDQDFFDKDELFAIAIQNNAYNYISDNMDDIDLFNDRWTSETDDEDMIDYLMENGATRDPDYYSDCAFAYCIDSDCLIAFNDDFRKKAIEKYISKLNISKDMLAKYLDEESDEEYDGERDLEDDASALGFCVVDGKIEICESDEAGSYIMDLLEWLEYYCTFQGSSWKLGASGYYFIDMDEV